MTTTDRFNLGDRALWEALVAVFGPHREPNSVITPQMVSEQLMHVQDQRRINVDRDRGPVPYIEIVGDGWYGGAYCGGMRGWLHDTDQLREVHHHDTEKRAEHYNEGYADAERQMTEPLPGYDEPDPGNPVHLRFAAQIVALSFETGDSDRQRSGRQLHEIAGRLEREQRERERRDCDWSDYRKEFGVRESAMTEAHRAFLAGWAAAQGKSFEGGAVR